MVEDRIKHLIELKTSSPEEEKQRREDLAKANEESWLKAHGMWKEPVPAPEEVKEASGNKEEEEEKPAPERKPRKHN